MRYFILIVFFLSFTISSQAAIKIQFEVSKIHGLFEFIEAISGNQNKCQQFVDLYKNSGYYNDENKALLNDFQKIKESSKTYNVDKLTLASIRSADLKEFKEKSKYAVNLLKRQTYFAVLDKFSLIYEELIWNKEKEKLFNWQKLLTRKVAKPGLDNDFVKVRNFLGSEWPLDKPFKIYLYAIPGKNGNSRGRSFGGTEAIQSVGILVDSKEIDRRLSLIFHEITHSLFSTRPESDKKLLLEQFKNSGSKSWIQVFCRLYEILPTTIGNGWAFERITNKLDKSPWYQNESLDTISRAIYPFFKSYIKNNRQLDQEFVDKLIEIFEKKYPDYESAFENIFCGVHVISAGGRFRANDLNKVLRDHFLFCGFVTNSSPISHPITISMAAKSPYTNVLVIHEGNSDELIKFIDSFPFLKSYGEKLMKKGSSYAFAAINPSKQKFVILKAQDMNQVKRYLRLIQKKGKLDKQNPFIVFE